MSAQNMIYLVTHPDLPEAPFALMAIDPRWAKETAKSVAGYIRQGCNVDRREFIEGQSLLNAWLDLPDEAKKGLFDKKGNCIRRAGAE